METYEPLKSPEYKRNELGQFDRPGKTLAKTAKNKMNNKQLANTGQFQPGDDERRAPGRPKGSPNKTTKALKEMILASLDRVGGEKYLEKLAIENSSAYSSLLKAVLPTTLVAENDGGVDRVITFTRILVYPDGHREVEGVAPKSLPAPDASHALPRPTDPTDDTNEGAV
jgi:hypothetical protein